MKIEAQYLRAGDEIVLGDDFWTVKDVYMQPRGFLPEGDVDVLLTSDRAADREHSHWDVVADGRWSCFFACQELKIMGLAAEELTMRMLAY